MDSSILYSIYDIIKKDNENIDQSKESKIDVSQVLSEIDLEKTFFYEQMHKIFSNFIEKQKISFKLEENNPKILASFIVKVLKNFVTLLQEKKDMKSMSKK